jgi:tRNA modification GTPase
LQKQPVVQESLFVNDPSDTIAAIATGPGEAGIAIVRISGPDSLAVADRIFSCSGAPPSKRTAGSFVHGFVKAGDIRLDEAILLVMRAPQSYTREEVVEIQCHGGRMPAARILQAVLEQGVRLAEPGEFTKRAFLNGRIDLVQAEAVMDLIKATTDRSAAAAMEQLEGRLSRVFNNGYDELVAACADLEAALDFSDEEVPAALVPSVLARLHHVEARINDALNTWEEGHLLRDGARVVISGKPNVGKSTLLNALLGKNRAIVSSVPGTTRDTIEETMILEGISIRLVDTAGLRHTSCEVEKEGVERARSHMQRADIHLHVIDASKSLDEEDLKNLSDLKPENTIIVQNKTDIGLVLNQPVIGKFTCIKSQLIYNEGLVDIKRSITANLRILPVINQHAVISERHKKFLEKTIDEISEAIKLLECYLDDYLVVSISLLRSAIDCLGQITGKIYYEELLNSIFSRFCIGK